MILSRKRLYKIKKLGNKVEDAGNIVIKKNIKEDKKGKSRRRKKALNLRKRTMKVYRGGVNRGVLSFVFPNDSNQLVLVSFNPSNTGNSSG